MNGWNGEPPTPSRRRVRLRQACPDCGLEWSPSCRRATPPSWDPTRERGDEHPVVPAGRTVRVTQPGDYVVHEDC